MIYMLVLHFAFHYVLKITNRGYIDPKGIGHIYIYICLYIYIYIYIYCMYISGDKVTTLHPAYIIPYTL